MKSNEMKLKRNENESWLMAKSAESLAASGENIQSA